MENEETQALPAVGEQGWSESQEADTWPGEHENGAGPPESVIEAIRARRVALAAKHAYDVALPGWQGQLVLRLEPIPGPQLTRIAARAEASKSPERTFNGNADILIAACSEVLARAREEDELVPLPGPGGIPCRLDETLCRYLAMEPVTARELVRELFKGAPSPDFAVGYAANEYVQWAAATNADLDEELLGES
jgi:hypothetical protein